MPFQDGSYIIGAERIYTHTHTYEFEWMECRLVSGEKWLFFLRYPNGITFNIKQLYNKFHFNNTFLCVTFFC